MVTSNRKSNSNSFKLLKNSLAFVKKKKKGLEIVLTSEQLDQCSKEAPRTQLFFILLFAAVCVGFIFRLYKLARWQPQLQPTWLRGSSLDLRANPGAQKENPNETDWL